jgi:tRNA threonylcarbamoyladenosine biosynthesis protein TsaB
MNSLAIDTCFGACSVAATWHDGSIWRSAHRCERLLRGHAERLLPMVAEVMGDAPFGFSSLERIIVTDGPGTFTGQRVGIAAARALALATGARVHVLSSLAVMAYGAADALEDRIDGRVLAVAVDARRGEIYFQAFVGADLGVLGPPRLTIPFEAAQSLGEAGAVAVGSGAELLAQSAGGSIAVEMSMLEPDVRFIPADAPLGSPVLPRPLYLRPPDAKPQDGASLARPA